MTKVEEIDLSNITDEAFVEAAITNIGEIVKNDKKLLVKDTFIKIFKYAGDYAKLRSKDWLNHLKAVAAHEEDVEQLGGSKSGEEKDMVSKSSKSSKSSNTKVQPISMIEGRAEKDKNCAKNWEE